MDTPGNLIRLSCSRPAPRQHRSQPILHGIYFGNLLADKVFDNNALRLSLDQCGAQAVIPSKADRKQTIPCDFDIYSGAISSRTSFVTSSNSDASPLNTKDRRELLRHDLCRQRAHGFAINVQEPYVRKRLGLWSAHRWKMPSEWRRQRGQFGKTFPSLRLDRVYKKYGSLRIDAMPEGAMDLRSACARQGRGPRRFAFLSTLSDLRPAASQEAYETSIDFTSLVKPTPMGRPSPARGRRDQTQRRCLRLR